MSSLVGTVWDSKKGMAPVTVVGDAFACNDSSARWLLVKGAGGRHRHITLAGLSRKFTRRLGDT